jgi:hypothetical protein
MKGVKVLDNVVELQKKEEQQDEKIILFQLVSPNSCIFVCLSSDEDNNKLDVGIIRR